MSALAAIRHEPSVLSYWSDRPAYLTALHSAQADADERCKPMLAMLADLRFHADAQTGWPRTGPGSAGAGYTLAYQLGLAIKELEGAIADEVLATATDHNLWDGIDPGDSPLASLAQMEREYRAYLGSCTGLQGVAAEGVLRKLTEETGL